MSCENFTKKINNSDAEDLPEKQNIEGNNVPFDENMENFFSEIERNITTPFGDNITLESLDRVISATNPPSQDDSGKLQESPVTSDVKNVEKQKKKEKSKKQRYNTQSMNDKLLKKANTDGFYNIPVPADADEAVAGGLHLAVKILAAIIIIFILYLVLLYFI